MISVRVYAPAVEEVNGKSSCMQRRTRIVRKFGCMTPTSFDTARLVGYKRPQRELPPMRMRPRLLAVMTTAWGAVFAWMIAASPHMSGQAPAGGQPAQGQPAAPPAAGGFRGGIPGTESGWATFQTRCSACHGNPNVERAASPATLREMTPEKIYDALVSGSMQAQSQGLNDGQKRA